jgi:hypothetical protein
MVAVGDKRFFTVATKLSNQFARMGMTMDQGSEALAELMDIQRLSGLAYSASQDQLIQSNEQMLRLMQSQAILTGRSIKQQQADLKAAAERASFRLLLAGKDAKTQAAAETMLKKFTDMGMDAASASGLVMEAMTGTATRAGAQSRLVYGQETGDTAVGLARQAIEGQMSPEEINKTIGPAFENMKEEIKSHIQEIAPTLAYAFEQGKFTEIATAAAHAFDIAAASTMGDPERLKVMREQAQKALEGSNVLGDTATNLNTAVNNASQAMGTIKAAVFDSAKPALDALASSILKLSEISLTAAQKFETLPGWERAGLGIGLPVAASTAAGAYSAYRMGKAAKNLPNVGAEVGSTARLGSRAVRGLAKGAGIGLAAEAGDMALEYLAPEFAKSTAGLVTSGALQGAALGATLGSFIPVIGTGIGAGIGALGGGLYSYLTAPSEPKAAPGAISNDYQAGTASSLLQNTFANMDASLKTLVDQLSENGPLYKILMQLSEDTRDGHRRLVIAVNNS